MGWQTHAPAAAPVMKAEQLSPAKADESVTNVQHEGVDEGGIVKVHGNHLVVLRQWPSLHGCDW